MRLLVCYQPNRTVYATVEDDQGLVFDSGARAFRTKTEAERGPAISAKEERPGLYAIDLVDVLPACHAGRALSVYVTRDDVVIAVFGNLDGGFTSRADWFRIT